MSIQAGDKIPSVTLQVMGAEGPQEVTTDELFAGKKVVMLAVPGAFTPGCSMTHLPGFVVNADNIKAKGVDEIVCTSVNDVFVMGAWGKDQNAEHITMLADGNGELAEALGLIMDASGFKMGPLRSKRYAMIVNDGVVELLNVDTKGIDKSSAETILAAL
ncbi:peroxiredoxin [Pseudomaricurvus alkylphenolicus]|uniref:peroxiredoxin n=1 Tax=Pseudomaricurvus alkylphenolicus TaxID=1306991 RepID=UPI0014207CB5|nr:peroxiredoxin [Pseudomaricurvus alkylphenolicus]NIB39633.1 peroxiredoxin [Pseudomaricurvus alkylphenolicus]